VFAFLRWAFTALIIGFLIYASLFSAVPLILLLGGFLITVAYLGFLALRYKRSRDWQHQRYVARFVFALLLYFVCFLAIMSVFTSVESNLEFRARYEPYISSDGRQRGYTFWYIDYPTNYERINSEDLNRYLRFSQPGSVRLVIKTTKDFGKLRAYSVEEVDGIRVNAAWWTGQPPWQRLRE
jgi:hypothetical protein